MKSRNTSLLALIICFFIASSCERKSPNVTEEGADVLHVNEEYVDDVTFSYKDIVYVPIYSEIYLESRESTQLLSATLSIRSTSLTDTTYIEKIDYYNNDGEKIKSYVDNTLVLRPLQSIDYVIETDDRSGGLGANFIVEWGGKSNTKPLFQSIMISSKGNQAFSFMSDGYSIKNSE